MIIFTQEDLSVASDFNYSLQAFFFGLSGNRITLERESVSCFAVDKSMVPLYQFISQLICLTCSLINTTFGICRLLEDS